jgi:hypothetical protein
MLSFNCMVSRAAINVVAVNTNAHAQNPLLNRQICKDLSSTLSKGERETVAVDFAHCNNPLTPAIRLGSRLDLKSLLCHSSS